MERNVTLKQNFLNFKTDNVLIFNFKNIASVNLFNMRKNSKKTINVIFEKIVHEHPWFKELKKSVLIGSAGQKLEGKEKLIINQIQR